MAKDNEPKLTEENSAKRFSVQDETGLIVAGLEGVSVENAIILTMVPEKSLSLLEVDEGTWSWDLKRNRYYIIRIH